MGRIPEDVIAQVIDRTDIVELISGYVPLKRAGRNFKACCPFHNEKTPSFVVTPDKQIFHCFGCAAGGNVVSFLMRQERLEFPEAVRMLAGKAGIEIPEDQPADKAKDDLRQAVYKVNEIAAEYFHQNLIATTGDEIKVAREYLKGRQIGPESAKEFQLGFAFDAWDGLVKVLRDKGYSDQLIEKSGLAVRKEGKATIYDRFRGRLIFTIFDQRGRPVAFGARAIKADEKVKYINSPETPVYTKGQHLYGFHWAKEAIGTEDSAVIVEGYMDFLRPFSAGVKNVVASLGTALTPDQVRLIRRYTKNVIMLFDMDTAGQLATLRSLDILLQEDMSVRVATLPDGKDPDAFIVKNGVAAFRQALGQAKSLFEFKLMQLTKQFDIQTIEGRGKICQEMLPTIDKVSSEVVRDGYLRELATRLKVGNDVILRENQRVLGKKIPVPSSPARTEVMKAPEKSVYLDEECLLRLMLSEPKWIAVARQSFAPEELRDRRVRMIVEKVYDLFQHGAEITAAGLVSCLEDDGARMLVVSSVQEHGALKGDHTRIFNDCVGRIRQAGQKNERQRLREEIREAETAGDQDRLIRLQQEFNMLIKG